METTKVNLAIPKELWQDKFKTAGIDKSEVPALNMWSTDNKGKRFICLLTTGSHDVLFPNGSIEDDQVIGDINIHLLLEVPNEFLAYDLDEGTFRNHLYLTHVKPEWVKGWGQGMWVRDPEDDTEDYYFCLYAFGGN